jgi:hypothetical protein
VELATCELLDRLCRVAPGLIAQFTTVPARCILATGVGISVLEHFGLHAEPVSVYAYAINAAYWSWLERNKAGPPPADARFVGVDKSSTGKGWPGHLVIGVDAEALVDLDLQAFNRPQKQILVPAAEWWEAYPGEPVWEFEMGGTLMVYIPTGDLSYRRAPDWKRRQGGTARALVGQVIRGLH